MIEGKAERAIIFQNFQAAKDSVRKTEAWIESHNIRFSVRWLVALLGVSEGLCGRVVESNPLVRVVDEKLLKPGPQQRYISMAILPSPTLEGIQEEADMTRRYLDASGRGARADFYELIRVRSLCLHQGKRGYKPWRF